MKLLHLSDLHLGKKLNEFSLYEDQKYILQRIVAPSSLIAYCLPEIFMINRYRRQKLSFCLMIF